VSFSAPAFRVSASTSSCSAAHTRL
jgi:hypothetical protein